nr:MAG TPA: hypothetical protein [Caudoviricetes sp.]
MLGSKKGSIFTKLYCKIFSSLASAVIYFILHLLSKSINPKGITDKGSLFAEYTPSLGI